MRQDRFQRGSGCFACTLCGRMTRFTGQGVDDMCNDCYELCGYDNQCNDSGETPEQAGVVAARDRHIAAIEKAGGNVARVKGFCGYLFPGGV